LSRSRSRDDTPEPNKSESDHHALLDNLNMLLLIDFYSLYPTLAKVGKGVIKNEVRRKRLSDIAFNLVGSPAWTIWVRRREGL
jgi:hypothetical protein